MFCVCPVKISQQMIAFSFASPGLWKHVTCSRRYHTLFSVIATALYLFFILIFQFSDNLSLPKFNTWCVAKLILETILQDKFFYFKVEERQVPTHCLLIFATSAGDLLDSVKFRIQKKAAHRPCMEEICEPPFLFILEMFIFFYLWNNKEEIVRFLLL